MLLLLYKSLVLPSQPLRHARCSSSETSMILYAKESKEKSMMDIIHSRFYVPIMHEWLYTPSKILFLLLQLYTAIMEYLILYLYGNMMEVTPEKAIETISLKEQIA